MNSRFVLPFEFFRGALAVSQNTFRRIHSSQNKLPIYKSGVRLRHHVFYIQLVNTLCTLLIQYTQPLSLDKVLSLNSSYLRRIVECLFSPDHSVRHWEQFHLYGIASIHRIPRQRQTKQVIQAKDGSIHRCTLNEERNQYRSHCISAISNNICGSVDIVYGNPRGKKVLMGNSACPTDYTFGS